jgi:hypothetical protein
MSDSCVYREAERRETIVKIRRRTEEVDMTAME